MGLCVVCQWGTGIPIVIGGLRASSGVNMSRQQSVTTPLHIYSLPFITSQLPLALLLADLLDLLDGVVLGTLPVNVVHAARLGLLEGQQRKRRHPRGR